MATHTMKPRQMPISLGGSSKAKNYGLWALQIIAALIFAYAGFTKLIGEEWQVNTFREVGVGQWLRYGTGITELVGAGLLVTPRLSGFGALLLAFVMVSAVVTHWFIIGGSANLAIGLLILNCVILVGRWEQTEKLVETFWTP